MDLREFLNTTPLPTRKDEYWKYVDLKFLEKTSFNIIKGEIANRVLVDSKSKKITIQISNATSSAQWQGLDVLPVGLTILSRNEFQKSDPKAGSFLSYESKHQNYFSNLNRASHQANIFIVVGKEFDSSALVELHFNNSASYEKESLVNSQVVFIIESNCEVSLIEKVLIKKNCFLNSNIDYFLAQNAKLNLLKTETGDDSGWSCHTARYELARDAQLFSTTATIGSNWSRHNVFVALNEEGAQASMLATYLAEKEQFVDHHTAIEHVAPHTTSLQKYTGVLADKAKAVFNGQVKIDRYAQKSSAEQINRNLLLSKTAEINTKPELQIDADDVKAKHGATVGQIQPDELFYLQSRGITEKKARTMLVRGFIEEIGLLQPALLKDVFFKEVSGFLDKVSGT